MNLVPCQSSALPTELLGHDSEKAEGRSESAEFYPKTFTPG